MVIAVIDEVKNSDASTDVNDSIEDVNDFLVTGDRKNPPNPRGGFLFTMYSKPNKNSLIFPEKVDCP